MDQRHALRVQARLLALNIRMAEMDAEVHHAQVDVNRLESRLEDARLARMMGEEAASPAELAPQLEASRHRLEERRRVWGTLRAHRSKVRVEMALQRLRERRRESAGEEVPEQALPDSKSGDE